MKCFFEKELPITIHISLLHSGDFLLLDINSQVFSLSLFSLLGIFPISLKANLKRDSSLCLALWDGHALSQIE